MKTDLRRVTELLPFPLKKRSSKVMNFDPSAPPAIEEDLRGARAAPKSLNPFAISLCRFVRRKSKIFGIWTPLVVGIISITLGIISRIWTPFQVLMNERLQMRPGLPAFDWWQTPPSNTIFFTIYLFNLTNAEAFLDGTDAKLRVEEVGPIVFEETVLHTNITFNENGTLSYIARRSATIVPEMTNVDLDAILVMPNLAVLGMASYLWDVTFFTKFGFNLLMRSLHSQPVVTKTIYQVLFNLSDPILGVAQTIAPSLVPTQNMGYVSRMYENSNDIVTVYIGSKYGHENFFQIDKFGGTEYLPGYNPSECQDKVQNSTEGIVYPQFLTKESVLYFWKKTICKVMPLWFQEEQVKYGVTGYKYVLPNNSYDRTYPSYSDCYISNPPLPNGLVDVSKCHFDFPIAASFPHFLYGDEILKTYVDGLKPNKTLHTSFALVEPTIGTPLESVARSQSNLVMRKLSGFNEVVNRFSNMVIPMFWAEFKQVGLPWYVSALVYFVAVLLPIGQVIMTIVFILTGLYLIFGSFRKFRTKRTRNIVHNTVMHFEHDIEIEESDKPLLVVDY